MAEEMQVKDESAHCSCGVMGKNEYGLFIMFPWRWRAIQTDKGGGREKRERERDREKSHITSLKLHCLLHVYVN